VVLLIIGRSDALWSHVALPKSNATANATVNATQCDNPLILLVALMSH